MKWFFIIAALCLFSCRTIKYVPVETVKTEKEYIDRVQRDSIHVHDSVFVLVKGDTVFKDKYHIVYRDRFVHDTISINKTDSIQVPYPVEKPLSKWQNLKLQVGGFAMSAIIVIILIVVGKIVYKLKK